MQLDLDNTDKELLASKLMQAFYANTYIDHMSNFFTQINDIFIEFDFLFSNKNVVNDILLIQVNPLEDCILSSAFFREFRNNFPKANIELIVDKQYSQLMDFNPYVNKVIPIDLNNKFDFIAAVYFCQKNLWNKQYELAINLNWEYNLVATLLNWLSGSIKRIAYKSNIYEKYCCDLLYDRELFDRRRQVDDYIYTKTINNPFDIVNEKERKLWILSDLDLAISSNKLEVWFSDDDKEYTKQFIKPNKRNILINTNALYNNACYPADQLIEALAQFKDDNFFIIVDSKKDIYNLLKENDIDAVDLTNKLTLTQLCALASQSDLYIGNFTGIVHIMETFNKPMIVMCKEAIEKENDHIGYLSYYYRYKPQSDNVIVLRPEYCLDECIETPITGGCCRDEPHCITQILPEEIVNTYKKISLL